MCGNVEKTENTFNEENKIEDTDREKMIIPKRVHVIKRGKRWGVKKQGTTRAGRIYKTKKEAVKEAQKYKEIGFDLIVHKEDGSIQR